METLVPDAELFHQETKVVAFGNLLAQGLSPPQGPFHWSLGSFDRKFSPQILY